MPAPSRSDIVELRDYWQKQVWASTHAHWANSIDPFIANRYVIFDDETSPLFGKGIYPPGASAIIDDAVDQLSVMDIKVTRTPTSQTEMTERKKRQADAVENGVAAIMMEAALQESIQTWKAAAWNLAAYGIAYVDGPRWDNTGRPIAPLRSDFEKDSEFRTASRIFQNERKTWMPIRIHAPHPSKVLMDPRDMRGEEGIRIDTWKARSVRRLAEARRKADRPVRSIRAVEQASLFSDLNITEYWSVGADPYWIFMVNDEILFQEVNLNQIQPLKKVLSSWGHETTRPSSGRMPIIRGILEPVLDMIRAEAQEASARHNVYIDRGFYTVTTTGDGIELEEQLAAGSRVIELQRGTETGVLDVPEIRNWMLQSEQMVRQHIERGTFSPVIVGQNQPNFRTVGQQALALNSASKLFEVALRQLEHLATGVAQDIARLIDSENVAIYARGYELKPSDLDHDYALWASFPNKDAAFELARKDAAMREVSMGLLDFEGYQIEAGREDITALRDRLDRDRAREHPLYAQQLIMRAFEEMGIDIAALQAASQGAGTPQNSQILGPNGMPISDMAGSTVQGQANVARQAISNEVTNPPRVL